MTPRNRFAVVLPVLVSTLAYTAPAYANMTPPLNTGDVIRDLVVAASLTAVIEVTVAAFFVVGRLKVFAAIGVLNLVTNPLFNLTLYAVAATRYSGRLALFALPLLEVVVVLIEWRVLLRLLGGAVWTPRRTLWLAIGMNAASLIGGNLLLAMTALPLGWWKGAALARLTSASS